MFNRAILPDARESNTSQIVVLREGRTARRRKEAGTERAAVERKLEGTESTSFLFEYYLNIK